MWIVRLALRRPYTFIVLAILIMLLGVFAIVRTPTDIFPNIKIPVVAVIWRYTGLSPEEMATRLVLGPSASRRPRSMTSSTPSRRPSPAQRWSSTSSSRTSTRSCRSRRSPRSRRRSCARAAGHHPALRPRLQRLLGADAAAGTLEPDSLGGADLRPRQQHHPHRARHRAGRLDALPLRRQAAPGTGGSRSAGAARPGPLRQRCHQRHRRAEPDPAGRHREDRRPRVLRHAQRQPAHRSRI